MSIDEFIERVNESPDYIKIDVDGLEDKIIEGMSKTLSNKQLKSLLVEVHSSTRETAIRVLEETGFKRQYEAKPIGDTTNIVFIRTTGVY